MRSSASSSTSGARDARTSAIPRSSDPAGVNGADNSMAKAFGAGDSRSESHTRSDSGPGAFGTRIDTATHLARPGARP